MDENVGQRESKMRREFLPQEMNWHGELHGFQDHKKIINDDIRQVSKLEKSSSMQTPMVWTSRERERNPVYPIPHNAQHSRFDDSAREVIFY